MLSLASATGFFITASTGSITVFTALLSLFSIELAGAPATSSTPPACRTTP
jgi:hypothetical protein